MAITDIQKYRNDVISLINNARLFEAFALFNSLLESNPSWEISEELSKLQMSYKYMLTYMAQGMDDPQKNEIYNNLLKSLYDLIDRHYFNLAAQQSRSQYYAIKQDFNKSNASISSVFADYASEFEKYKLFADIPYDESNKAKIIELTHNMEKAETRLFNYVWTMFRPTAEEITVLDDIMRSSDTPDNLKALLLSAIFLNIDTFYDKRLLLLLFDLYECYGNNTELAVRTVCIIFFALLKYNNIAALSRSITLRLEDLKQNEKFKNALYLIVLQFIRSCDTDKLTKMMHDELLPHIMNATPDLLKKLKGKNPDTADIIDIESNPEWEEFLEKSGFANKIKEINEIQMEGGDVFMGTFSKLKSFPFFYTVANWFIPFSINHSIVAASSITSNRLVAGIISNAKFLCDSDRYSFCLSVNSIPPAQRDAMLAQFDSQNEMLDEMSKADPASAKIDIKHTISNYMQDLYRFFKLYNQRRDFEDVFTGNILDIGLLSDIICTPETLSLIGEYYLKNKYYDLALTFFKKVVETSSDYQPNTIQKIGFCYQNLKMYDEAIKYYLKFDLFDNSNLWNIKHLASSYKASGNAEKALEYYHKAESMSPDNLPVCLSIGHCLLELNRVDDALKYYFKVDYLSRSDIKALRPIAWCLFLQKNFSQSEEYYKKIIASTASAEDYMNFGHLLLAKNDTKGAIAAYKESLKLSGNDFNKFADNFNSDRKYLATNDISDNDMALILDIIHYNI